MSNLLPDSSPLSDAKGTWHLVTLTQASKRELFCQLIFHTIEQEKLQHLILSVEIPKEPIYQNLVLMEVSNLKAVRERIQQIDYIQRIEPKPLTSEQVNKMLS